MTAAGIVVLGWACAVGVVGIVAHRRAVVPRGGARAWHGRPPLVVRACVGAPPHLARSLRSIATARLPDGTQIRIVFANDDDPGVAIARDCARDLRRAGLAARVVTIGSTPSGLNAKVCALAAVAATSADRIIVGIDADVDCSDLDVDALLAPLRDPTVGATWSPVCETEPRTRADGASATILGGSLHAFCLLGALDRRGLTGKVFAVAPAALVRIAGFEPLAAYLGEDMELARRVQRAGFTTKMVPLAARSLAAGRSWTAVFTRFSRWILVIRAQRPRLLAAYPLLLAAAPLQTVAALGLALAGDAATGLLAGLGAIAMRLAAARSASRYSASRMRPGIFACLAADVLLLASFVRALGPYRIHWGDRSLRLGRNGRLQP